MKRLTVLAGLISAGLAASASANPYDQGAQYGSPQFTDVAQVISSTPILERIAVPRRECRVEQVAVHDARHHNRRGYNDRYQEQRVVDDGRYNQGGAGAVLGAVIGGVIGHQVGNSSGGRDRGTAVGAILGGVIGNDIERNSRGRDDNYRYASNGYGRDYVEVQRAPEVRNVERCTTVSDYRDEVRGYDVRYRYHGRDYTTRLSYQPGPTIPVSVDVRPNTQPAPSYQRGY